MYIRKKIFLMVLFLLFALLCIAGCTSREERQVKKALKQELDQLKSSDIKTIENSINAGQFFPDSEQPDELSEEIANIFQFFYKDFSYDIRKVQVEDDYALAETELSVIDGHALARSYARSSIQKRVEQDAGPAEVVFTLKDSYLLLEDILSSKNFTPQKVSVNIQLNRTKDTWKVIHNSDLDNALTGNFQKYITDSDLLSPSEIVEAHFDVIKGFDAEQMKIYLSLDHMLNTDDDYSDSVAHAVAAQITKTFDYKILEEKRDQNKASVKVSITSIDFTSILNTYKKSVSKWLKDTAEPLEAGAAGRREQERKFLLSAIEGNKNSSSHKVTIELINDGVNWKIQMDSEIAKAIFGDMQSALDSISDDIK